MASVTNLGSASGLPLEDTLDKLQKVEDKKLSLYMTRADSYQTRIDAYAKLQNGLESLQRSVKALSKTETMAAMKGSVTGGDALTATLAAEGVTAGLYSIKVTQLAQAQSLRSVGVPSESKTEDVTDPATGKPKLDINGNKETKTTTTPGRAIQHGATGSFEIELKGGSKQTIDLKGDTSLNAIVKKINDNDQSGLLATVINNGKGEDYLMLTAKDTGEAAAVKRITVTGDPSLKQLLEFDSAASGGAMTEQKAQNALLNINGLDIESGSNSVSTAIDGVTLNLTATTDPAKPITLKLEADTSVAIKAIQDFVNNYNTLQTTINDLTTFDANAHTSQPLTGDSTTRSILSSIRGALLNIELKDNPEGVRSLIDLGIEIKTDKRLLTLKVNHEKLNKALTEHPAAVSRLLGSEVTETGKDGKPKIDSNGKEKKVNASYGLVTEFNKFFKSVLGNGGALETRTSGLAKTKADLGVQYTRAKAASDAEMERTRASFIALDKYVSQMSVTGNYLTQQFAALNKSNK